MYDGGPIATRLRSVGDLPADHAKEFAAEFTGEIVGWPPARRPGAARLSEALVLTALSAALPGLAHLRARRVRTGTVMLISYALGLTAAAVAVSGHQEALLGLAVRPGWLAVLTVAAVLLAGLWALLLVRSYAVLRPARLSPAGQLFGGTLVAVMCLLVVVPPLTAARYGYLQRDLVNSVFMDEPAEPADLGAPGGPVAVPAGASSAKPDPWAGLHRLNILLVGGDADQGRPGVRTDSMTVASVDTRTGDTVLLSLPRNLQHVPVWTGRGQLAFPAKALLNSVYRYGTAHPRAVGDRVRNPGAELLKRTAGHILGLPVHYYGMVDMRGFRQIVDAIGGVRICVGRDVPVPREQVPAGVLRAGPLTVLRSFQRLSQVFKYLVSTDLPRGLLPHLIALSGRVKGAQISSIQFVPPLVAAGDPDFTAIRRLAGQAVSRSGSGRGDLAALHILGHTCT